METNSDEYLLKLFRKNKTKKIAFEQIVRKYQEQLYWHIRKFLINHDDTDDVLQNTLIKAWKGLENFRAESKLYTWLYRIATNEALTCIEKRKRYNMVSAEDHENWLSNTLESDPYFSGDEAAKKLQQAIFLLPEKQRLVFNMKYYDNMKYDDIAEILDTSVGALKASYHHAVKKIEKFLIND